MKPEHAIIADPVPFKGGHKNAAGKIIELLRDENIRITVLTCDPDSWQLPGVRRQRLLIPVWLLRQESGIGFYLQHLLIAFNILLVRILFGRIDKGIGISGPGVDMSLYLAQPLLRYRIVQMIKGPVAASRSIGICLKRADSIHYLHTMGATLDAALATLDECLSRDDLEHCSPMENGLLASEWPTPCVYDTPHVFWAASLLRWKGLDHLITALSTMPVEERPAATICYIRPIDTSRDISSAPVAIDGVDWHESPMDLDRLRAECNLFVSTSTNEPFGLSILEAIAAGQCVLIPEDGAYWDQRLTDEINCVKYRPGDAEDLREKLHELKLSPRRIERIGTAAREIAEYYRAEKRYREVLIDISAREMTRRVGSLAR